jgi:hypothetical protein
MTSRKELILATAEDSGRDFAAASHEDDEELSQDDIYAAVASGEVTIDEIASAFIQGMHKEGLGT